MIGLIFILYIDGKNQGYGLESLRVFLRSHRIVQLCTANGQSMVILGQGTVGAINRAYPQSTGICFLEFVPRLFESSAVL